MFDLPFGINVTRVVSLEGVPNAHSYNAHEDSAQLLDRARHCLIVLLGGKNVAVVPAPGELDRWRERTNVRAQVYLNERIFGEPVGFTPAFPGFARPLLEVSTFYLWLKERGFTVSDVTKVMNGARRG